MPENDSAYGLHSFIGEYQVVAVNSRGRPTEVHRPAVHTFFGSAAGFRDWLAEQPPDEAPKGAKS